jgi:hypothetical protein
MRMAVEQLVECELAGETKVLGENLPHATLSTTNPTWPDHGSNLGCHGGKPATNCLSYDMALPSSVTQNCVILDSHTPCYCAKTCACWANRTGDLQGDCSNLALNFSLVNAAFCLTHFLSKRDTDEHNLITNLKIPGEAGIWTSRYSQQNLLLRDLYDLFFTKVSYNKICCINVYLHLISVL